MKKSGLLVLAVASLGLVACEKEELNANGFNANTMELSVDVEANALVTLELGFAKDKVQGILDNAKREAVLRAEINALLEAEGLLNVQVDALVEASTVGFTAVLNELEMKLMEAIPEVISVEVDADVLAELEG